MTIIAFYDHTRALFAAGEVELAALKAMLVYRYTFNPKETDIEAARDHEFALNGWPRGGEPLVASVEIVDVHDAVLTALDISVLATGGPIGPADGAVVYQDLPARRSPLFHVDFGEDELAGAGFPFEIAWHPKGIARWTR